LNFYARSEEYWACSIETRIGSFGFAGAFMATGGFFSIWWLLAPGAVAIGLIVAFFLVRGRRVGYLASLSLAGMLALGCVWTLSYRYDMTLYVLAYRVGPNYFDYRQIARLNVTQGTGALNQQTTRNARSLTQTNSWESDARKYAGRPPFIEWAAFDVFGDHMPDSMLPSSAWKGHAPWWAYLLEVGSIPERPAVPGTKFSFGGGAAFHLGILIPPLCVFPAIWAIRVMRRRRDAAAGLCPNCFYDLRAHKPGDKCPECGTPVPARPDTRVSGAQTPPIQPKDATP
jgi:hypothetical protein